MDGPYAGILLKIKDSAGVVIAGIKTKSGTFPLEPIDVTTDDENGFRTFLKDAAGEIFLPNKMIDLSFDGLTKNVTLIKAAATQTGLVGEYTLEIPDGAKIVGDFALTNLEITGEREGAMTISGSLQSHGEWTWTDAP